MFWPSLLMTGDMWAAQAEHFARPSPRHPRRPAGPRRSQKLTAMFDFADCARCIVDILDALRHAADTLRRQLVGRHDRRHVRRDVPRPDRQRRADELHRIGRGHPAEARVRVPAADGQAARRGPAAADPVGAQGVPRADDVSHPPRRRRIRAGHRAGGRHLRRGHGRCAASCPPGPTSVRCFAKISTPVLVVAGAEDATFPLPETIAMAEAIPDAAVAVLDGVAHLAGLENPPLVNKLIEEFVFRG